jgi:hypothetical protein
VNKPSSAEERPVPANSAAAENAMNADGNPSSRQPSRQQQLMSRVGSATGAAPEEVKKKLQDERKEMKKAILVWNKQFIDDNKREPTKAEREQGVGNFYRRYRQVIYNHGGRTFFTKFFFCSLSSRQQESLKKWTEERVNPQKEVKMMRMRIKLVFIF